MAALSDYLESGLLHHLFREDSFAKPSQISIALTSAAPVDSDTGATISEIPSGLNGSGTGYTRIVLGAPADSGNDKWSYDEADAAVGSGVIKNASSHAFDTALVDWGWVSGVAICDNATYGAGNLLIHAQLDNPRVVYTGDSLKFDTETFQLSFK